MSQDTSTNSKLYVGGLAYAVNDAALESLFAGVGEVRSAKVITDFDSGRSKGFGFVEMATEELANEAIEKLNGATHEGRTITVSKAKPKEGGGRGGNGGGRFRGNNNRGGGRGHGGGHGGGNNRFGGGGGRFGGDDRY